MLPKIRMISKKLQIRVVQNSILYEKVCKRIYVSPTEVERGDSKDQYIWNLIMYGNENLGSLHGSTLSKIRMVSKEASNKSCLELNFVQKSVDAHMSISPRSEARGLQKIHVWNLIMYRNGELGLIALTVSLTHQWKFNHSFLKIFLK